MAWELKSPMEELLRPMALLAVEITEEEQYLVSREV